MELQMKNLPLIAHFVRINGQLSQYCEQATSLNQKSEFALFSPPHLFVVLFVVQQ